KGQHEETGAHLVARPNPRAETGRTPLREKTAPLPTRPPADILGLVTVMIWAAPDSISQRKAGELAPLCNMCAVVRLGAVVGGSGGGTARFSRGKVPRKELAYAIDRIIADTREHVAQVALGLDAIENAGANDGIKCRRPCASGIRTGEQPVLSSECWRTNLVLHGIVANLQPTVLDVAVQSDPARARIADRLGKLAAPRNALELLIEPGGELLEPGFGQLRTHLLAHVRRLALDGPLDVEERADLVHRLFGDRRTARIVDIEKEPPRMAPATNFRDRTRLGICLSAEQLTKARVAVGMKLASERGEMRPAVLAFAVGRVLVEYRRRRRPSMRSLIAQVHPEAAGLGLALTRSEHWKRGVVGVDHASRHHVLAHLFGQRLQQPGRLAHPVGKLRTVEVDALAGVDIGLPIKRDMIAILGDRHVGDHAGVRLPARDWQRRHRGLHHALAFAA